MKFYRLVFRDGNRSAWSSDFESVKNSAEFFRAEIEEMTLDFFNTESR